MTKPSRSRISVQFLAHSGLIAAVYAALCVLLAPIGYGPFQLRVAEALTLLPLITPAAIPGLAVGCLIANLWSPYGLVDIICGSSATLLAALITYWIGKRAPNGMLWLAPLPPVLVNAVVIGAELAILVGGGLTVGTFFTFAGQIAVGQLLACFGLGVPLVLILRRVLRHPGRENINL